MNTTEHSRTNYCGELTRENIGQTVLLKGWAAKIRNLGSLIFIDLRDTTGICQIVIKEENEKIFELADTVKSEYVLEVRGAIYARESVNPQIPTGEIEVIADHLEILNTSETPPIYIKDDDNVSDTSRLKYRYLDLRKPSLQRNLKIRSKVSKVTRDYLDENRFIEIETPFLSKPTPEGARDYLVPSRINAHRFYALPQSPQLMKQLLMVAGMDRYYQIVKCFRDEDLRANRQPEFTQIDLEMSFVDVEDVIAMNEGLLKRLFREILDVELKTPLPRMDYHEAMERYGSDKPDLRIDFHIENVSEIFRNTELAPFADAISRGGSVRGINFSQLSDRYSRKAVEKLVSVVKDNGAKALFWLKIEEDGFSSSFKKFIDQETFEKIRNLFSARANDLILFIADDDNVVLESLSTLRTFIAREQGLLKQGEYAPVWIVNFPLFERDLETGALTSKHHPFTHPVEEDLDLLETNPELVRSKAYDIVINGDEMGGGSIRINNSHLQQRVFRALELTDEEIEGKFGFFTDAMKYGAPPHGGIAYGLDRLTMLFTGADNIRDVIAFPKTQSATCLMTGAPSFVDDEQLSELHISLKDDAAV